MTLLVEPRIILAGPRADAIRGSVAGERGLTVALRTVAVGDESGSDPFPVTLVPYHSWAERGPSTMRVWLPASAV